MDIQKNESDISIRISKDELMALIAEKYIVTEKQFVSTANNVPAQMWFKFTFVKNSEPEIAARKKSLEEAERIKLSDFIEEFRKTSTAETKKTISHFCNGCMRSEFKYVSLADVISKPKNRLWVRGTGGKGMDLFETFLISKGHRFAQEIGKEEYV